MPPFQKGQLLKTFSPHNFEKILYFEMKVLIKIRVIRFKLYRNIKMEICNCFKYGLNRNYPYKAKKPEDKLQVLKSTFLSANTTYIGNIALSQGVVRINPLQLSRLCLLAQNLPHSNYLRTSRS
jgi:hypothetical protein